MHQDYPDILSTMTAMLRESHRETKEHGEGPSPSCTDDIDPVTGSCRCVAAPLWWDANGVPRFAAHHPKLCPDIYADQVALVRISCQGCGHEFLVQLHHSRMERALEALRSTAFCPITSLEEAVKLARGASHPPPEEWTKRLDAIEADLVARRAVVPQTLADDVRDNSIHYGDPPNVGCCPAGPTMNCWNLSVVEFWHQRPVSTFGWFRDHELEIDLNDLTAPERLERL